MGAATDSERTPDDQGLLGGNRSRAASLTVVLTVALAGLVFATQLTMLPPFEVEDAWIGFSYAKNLAAGQGFVFGHAGRVEGYSNFLWIVLLAPFLAVDPGMSPILAARLLALPFALLLGWSTFRIVQRASGSRMAAALALVLLATASDVALAALSGLETFAYTAIVTAGFALQLTARAEPRMRPYALLLFVGAALMRIDGMVPLAFVLAWDAAEATGGRPARLRQWVGLAAPPVAVYATWFAWRWWYYGLFLPSTYYAKALIPVALPHRGQEYVFGEVVAQRLWVFLPAAGILLWSRNRSLLAPIAFVLVHLAYVCSVGGDWMPFARFVVPVVPLITAVVATGVSALVRLLEARGRTWRAAGALVGLGVSAWMALALDHRFVNSADEKAKLAFVRVIIRLNEGYRRAATLLGPALPAGARLVTDYPGTMAFYTDATIIDMFGLTTPLIARSGGTEGINPIFGRTCPQCYPALHPEFFHVNEPLVRSRSSFATAEQVVAAVWQSDTIGRYVDFARDFVVGRAVRESTGEAIYFLERRKPGASYEGRSPGPDLTVEYPFEPPPPRS